MALAWTPCFLAALFPFVIDGLVIRKISQTHFDYPIPMAHRFSLYAMLGAWYLIFLWLTLPFSIPPQSMPVGIFVIAYAMNVFLANTQKRTGLIEARRIVTSAIDSTHIAGDLAASNPEGQSHRWGVHFNPYESYPLNTSSSVAAVKIRSPQRNRVSASAARTCARLVSLKGPKRSSNRRNSKAASPSWRPSCRPFSIP